ncbi:fructose-specific PTS transporter subunit EIIC [Adlercreutzia sp. R25]|uniref:Fructose-specific PTS transporter subunit EIIC n=1 Tax=Adlercreutzia shanghongiae TaxID=3111773 RepID=A0ABU6IXW9_9ACTN|nr:MULTISPECIES: fructose-specific PTS transporter subunit EIIC [unclassified Adlercreutzia]MEC4271688.1 fructose-specific PTS transporter subunit EIIC [Adlercreutzia sp. R25]MEC4294694.1 fructose-specific PTS transporter subunit EIIC [Adlercreutzia sp. R22]
MRIVDLLQAEAIAIGGHPADKAAAIAQLVDLHDTAGNLNDKEAYKAAIIAREQQGTTAVGEGIAIPHAKTDATKRAALAAMTAPEGVDYGAFDGPSSLLFMIAAPDDGGDTHLEVLSRLMTILMDIEFRQKLMEAATPEEFLRIIDAKERERFADEVKAEAAADMEGSVEDTELLIDEVKAERAEKKAEKEAAAAAAEGYRILAVTACPTGIAHTYMAAEALTKAGEARGIPLKAETNGSGGTKNRLTKAEIAAADGIIVAADKEVEMARFDGKLVVIVKAADGINRPDELIDKIVSGEAGVYHAEKGARGAAEDVAGESAGRKIYKHLMEGVSHMLPFVVSGGLFIALAFLIDGIAGVPQDGDFGTGTPVSAWFKTIGGFAFSFMVPILAAYIAQSIADRPGLVVGFVGGFMATLGSTFGLPGGDIPSGFLGGLLAGFAGGYAMLGIEKLCEKMPDSLAGIKQILIYPLAGLGAIAVIMCAVGPFMGMINTGMSNALTWLSDNNFGILLGMILAGMMAIDMGGPFNKAAYVFGTGMLALGTDASFQIMASVMIGGMVPPIAIALSTTFFKNRWTADERKNGPVNYIMGLSFITEGAIPYAASDPLRVIPSCVVGSAVAGGLSWLFGCTLMAPHGGIFVVPVIGGALMYLVALAAGSVVGMLMLALLKKKRED